MKCERISGLQDDSLNQITHCIANQPWQAVLEYVAEQNTHSVATRIIGFWNGSVSNGGSKFRIWRLFKYVCRFIMKK